MPNFVLVPNVLGGDNMIDFNRVIAVFQTKDEGGSMILVDGFDDNVISTPLAVNEVYALLSSTTKARLN